MSNLKYVHIKNSAGYGKNGMLSAYVRPLKDCFNKSRKVSSPADFDLKLRLAKCIYKWYTPMHYWNINGHIIGSNTKDNARLEWRRVCNKKDVGKSVEIILIE